MKRIAKILICVIIMIATLFIYASKESAMYYHDYFNNFKSTAEFKAAKKMLTLPENVFVSSYDDTSGYFITSELILDNEGMDEDVYAFGFCTYDRVISAPKFTKVVDIRNDFAIVTSLAPVGNTVIEVVGMVSLLSDNLGLQFGFASEYNKGADQFKFLNDKYVAILGNKNGSINAESATYYTIYDYVSRADLLEVSKVSANYLSRIDLYDNFIVVNNNNAISYYDFNNIGKDGYITRLNTFEPFSEEENIALSNIQTTNYYLGNGWFIRIGTIMSSEEFTGFHYLQKIDGEVVYVFQRSERFNIISMVINETDKISFVANQYTKEFIESTANALNADIQYSKDANGIKQVYNNAVVPMSSLVKAGYSIVYHYFFPTGSLYPSVTFTIYDKNAKVISMTDTVMPLLFIDGVGSQVYSFSYEVLFGDVEFLDYNNIRHSLLKAEDKLATYETVIFHGGMGTIYKYEKSGVGLGGCYDIDGKFRVPFKYYELTPYFGDYATGSEVINNVRHFYRIDKFGAEKPITDMYGMHNGVYKTFSNDKFALYNNGGKLLIDNCSEISVLELFLKDGKFVSTVVCTVENNCGVIYKLS